jgi:hypothetical protein
MLCILIFTSLFAGLLIRLEVKCTATQEQSDDQSKESQHRGEDLNDEDLHESNLRLASQMYFATSSAQLLTDSGQQHPPAQHWTH